MALATLVAALYGIKASTNASDRRGFKKAAVSTVPPLVRQVLLPKHSRPSKRPPRPAWYNFIYPSAIEQRCSLRPSRKSFSPLVTTKKAILSHGFHFQRKKALRLPLASAVALRTRHRNHHAANLKPGTRLTNSTQRPRPPHRAPTPHTSNPAKLFLSLEQSAPNRGFRS